MDDRDGAAQRERNKAVVGRAFEAWAAGTGSPFDLLTDEATWTIAGTSAISRTYPDKSTFMAEVMGPFHARLDGRLRPTVHRMYADGDVVVVYFTSKGTARDGQPFGNTYVWFLQMRNDRVIEVTALFDTLHLNDLWLRVTPPAAA